VARSSEGERGPIFVVGPPRSGTHLLRFCLSRHDHIHVGPETGFFIKIYGNRRLLRPHRFAARAEEIVDLLLRSGDPTMEDVRSLRAELVEAVRAGPSSYRMLAEALLGRIAAAAGKRRWGEKTPLHVLYVDQILQLFPEARILVLGRDSRNVIASYLKSPLLPDDFPLALAHVRLCVEAGTRAVARGQARLVRYEDLVREPESTLRDVAEYIGEEFQPAMLTPGMMDSSFRGPIMQRQEGLGIVADPDEARRWMRVLTEEQARAVDILVDGAPGRVSRDLRAAVRRRLLVQRGMHVRSKLGLFGLKLPFRRGRSR